jgi:hypothetical protein
VVAGPLLLVLGCIFDIPRVVVTATSKWLDRSGSGRSEFGGEAPVQILGQLIRLLRGSIPHCGRSCILEISASGGLVWWKRKLRGGGREEVGSVDGGRARIRIVGYIASGTHPPRIVAGLAIF